MSFKAVFNTYTDRDLVETCVILTKRDARFLQDVEHVTHHVELSPNCQTSPSSAKQPPAPTPPTVGACAVRVTWPVVRSLPSLPGLYLPHGHDQVVTHMMYFHDFTIDTIYFTA